MDHENTGLVIEGGGLRGVYTSGVIRFFMDNGINFSYVIGVSMGACNGANYISRQPDRNRIVNIEFVNDPRYISYKRLFLNGELFGMEFIFNTIPFSLVPFDFNTFFKNEAKFVIGVTDCKTGDPIYYEKSDLEDDSMDIFRATCTLPFLAKPVQCRGRILMDGGLSDPVPIERSISEGNKKNVLILTRPKGYRKKHSLLHNIARLRYPRLRGLHRALATRNKRYNDVMDRIDELEKSGLAYVVRPVEAIEAGRVERDRKKLLTAYNLGYEDASSGHEGLKDFLQIKA